MSTSTPAGYTDEEVTTSVENIVLSTVRRPYDTLGTRRTDITFTDVQQAAAGVFLLYRDAPFYVLFLATKRTLEAITTEAALIDQILSAVMATGRDVLPVDDLTTLFNARSALVELEGAVGQRQQSFQDIEKVPAYQRYQTNVDQFLSTAGSNVKAGGELVATPQQARADLPALLSDLRTQHLALVSSAMLLANAISNFSSLNLPALVASSVLSSSRQVLSDHLDTLSAQSPEERLTSLRDVTLDLLAQKGIIKQFTSFQGPTASLSVSGVGFPYSDSTHPSTPAFITATSAGPYALVNGKNVLDFYLDASFSPKFTQATVLSITADLNLFEVVVDFGASIASFGFVPGDVLYPRTGANAGSRWVVKTVNATTLVAVGDHTVVTPDNSPQVVVWPAPSVSVPVATSLLPKIDALLVAPFNIDASNDTLLLTVDGVAVTATLSHGATQSIGQVCTDINNALTTQAPGKPLVAEPYSSPLKYDGLFVATDLGGGNTRFDLVAGSLDGLAIDTFDKFVIVAGPGQGNTFTIVGLGASPIHSVTVSGPTMTTGSKIEAQIGRFNKVRIRCTTPATCLSAGTTISVNASSLNTAALPLGFSQGLSSTGRSVRVADFVKDFAQRTTKVTAVASSSIDFAGKIRTEPLAPTKAVLYLLVGTGNVVASGLNIVLTTTGLLASGAQVGDVVCLRGGSVANALFTITTLSDTSLSATGLVGVATATSVPFEIGKNFSFGVVAGRTLTIDVGPNKGSYEIASQGGVPFEFLLTNNFPLRQSVTSQPIQMTGSLSLDSVKFSSQLKSVTSSIQVLGSAADFFFGGGVSAVGIGTTPWFQLPSEPLGTQPGDFIEVHATDYVTPSAIYTIQSLETGTLIVKVSPEVPASPNLTFSDATPPPFAKLQAGNVEDTSALTAGLAVWMSDPVNSDAYFTDLNRFLNPLLVNTNPTAVEVTDAINRLRDLSELLTISGAQQRGADATLSIESILDVYSANKVAAIDNLITTYSSKGADRALDILLSANFTGFFGLTVDTSSYAGTMLAAARDVARNDMPVSKVNRADAVQGTLISSTTSDDYEFSTNDLEKGPQVDPPAAG